MNGNHHNYMRKQKRNVNSTWFIIAEFILQFIAKKGSLDIELFEGITSKSFNYFINSF